MSLSYENEEMKDANMIISELKRIKNAIEKDQTYDSKDDKAIKYLTEKIVKISDVNLNLKNEIEKIESALNSYESNNNLSNDEITNVILHILHIFIN
jgi:cysteinyl-tRNA synthetase